MKADLRRICRECFCVAGKILIRDLGKKILFAQITNKHAFAGEELSVDNSVQTVAYSISLQDVNRARVCVCVCVDFEIRVGLCGETENR
jgi:hypothetical protein